MVNQNFSIAFILICSLVLEVVSQKCPEMYKIEKEKLHSWKQRQTPNWINEEN